MRPNNTTVKATGRFGGGQEGHDPELCPQQLPGEAISRLCRMQENLQELTALPQTP